MKDNTLTLTIIVERTYTDGLHSYPVEHVSPSLERDALEHSEHGLAKVVKAGDAPLGALPVLPTLVLILTAVKAATRIRVLHHFPLKMDFGVG